MFQSKYTTKDLNNEIIVFAILLVYATYLQICIQIFYFILHKKFLKHIEPSIAQLVERRTVEV